MTCLSGSYQVEWHQYWRMVLFSMWCVYILTWPWLTASATGLVTHYMKVCSSPTNKAKPLQGGQLYPFNISSVHFFFYSFCPFLIFLYHITYIHINNNESLFNTQNISVIILSIPLNFIFNIHFFQSKQKSACPPPPPPQKIHLHFQKNLFHPHISYISLTP